MDVTVICPVWRCGRSEHLAMNQKAGGSNPSRRAIQKTSSPGNVGVVTGDQYRGVRIGEMAEWPDDLTATRILLPDETTATRRRESNS